MASLLGFSFFGTCNGVSGFVSPRDFALPQPLHILVDTKFPFLWDVDVYRCKTIKLEDDKFLNFIGLYTKIDDFRGVREGAFGGVGIFVRDGYIDTQKAVALLKAMQINLLAAASDNRKFVRTIDEAKEGGYLKAPSGFADLADSFKPGERGLRSPFQIQAQYIVSAQDTTVSDPIGFLDFAQDEVDGRVSDLFFCSSMELHSEIRRNYLDTLSPVSAKDILNNIVSAEKEAFKAAAAAEVKRKQAAERARAAEAQRSAERQHYETLDRYRKLELDYRNLETQVDELTKKRDKLSFEMTGSGDSVGRVKTNAGDAGSATVLEGVIESLKSKVAESEEALKLSENQRTYDDFIARRYIIILGVLCIIFFCLSVFCGILLLSSGDGAANSVALKKQLDSVTQQLESERENNKALQASNDKLISDINQFKKSIDAGAVVPASSPSVPGAGPVAPAKVPQVDAQKAAAEKKANEAVAKREAAQKAAAEKKASEEAKKKADEATKKDKAIETGKGNVEASPRETAVTPAPTSTHTD